MSIKDIQISKSRYNQGNAIISKDWEQVRNKKFQEEDLLWNDSQININGIKEQEQLKIQQNTKVLSNQEANSQRQDSENCLQQKQVFSFKNSNSRRFQYFSKYSTKSRTKTIDLDISNMNESSRMNQTQEFMTSRDQRSCSQNNQPQTQTDSKYRNRTNSFESYKLFQKSIVLITKLKLRLRNYYKNFTDIYKSRLLNNDMRLMINDLSDSIEANESFLEILEKSCSKFVILNQFKKIPLFNISSKLGFYIKLILVWLNIIYLLLFSIVIVFQVNDSFSQQVFQIIQYVWLIELIFNFNSQIQHEMEIVTSRGRAFLIYFKKKLIFDLVPWILNSQLEHSPSTILFQVFQFVKIFNINHDLKYIQLQLCIRVKKHYIIQLINLIFRLFFIGHIISCLWYLIGYIEANYFQDKNSWLNQDLYTDAFWWQIYFSALYWSLTLMATGSNICLANLEIMFIVIIMLFTTISFGYLITTIGDILSEMNSKDLKRKQDTNTINNYMRQVNTSKELQANVNLYIQLYYQNNFQEEEQSKKQVIDKLSTDLQESLKREQYKETILQIDFLLNKRLSLETLQDLALYIQEEFYLPNQRIKLDNQLSLIFIIQGEMEITNTQDQENKYNNYDKKKKLDAGQNFGLIEFITGIPSNHILKSSKFTQIIRIDRADFIKIIQQNDLEYQKFCELRDKIQFYSNFQDLNMKCSFCQSYFHQDINCEQFIINRKQINYKSRLNQSQTQKRVSHKRKKIRNSNPLYIQYIVSQQAQILVEDFKKQKQTDILEQLNITVSESDISDNSVTNQQYAHKQYQSQKDIDHIKTSQNSYQQKIENNLRKQSIFLINKQSFKDLDVKFNCYFQILKVNQFFKNKQDQQKSQIAYPHEQQGIDKQNLNGFETFALNSFSAFNESQRVTFKDFDKGGICKEGTENNKLSEEGIDSLSALTPSKIQAFQATNKSVKNMSSKYLQRFSCFYDNQDNSQQENLKEEINKLIESFKLLNQTLLCPTNKNRKSSTFQFNKSQDIQENQLKYIKVFRSEFICYDFEQLKDYVNYFPQGNSKEVILRQKNQFKKKFKRTNISSQFQSKN